MPFFRLATRFDIKTNITNVPMTTSLGWNGCRNGAVHHSEYHASLVLLRFAARITEFATDTDKKHCCASCLPQLSRLEIELIQFHRQLSGPLRWDDQSWQTATASVFIMQQELCVVYMLLYQSLLQSSQTTSADHDVGQKIILYKQRLSGQMTQLESILTRFEKRFSLGPAPSIMVDQIKVALGILLTEFDATDSVADRPPATTHNRIKSFTTALASMASNHKLAEDIKSYADTVLGFESEQQRKSDATVIRATASGSHRWFIPAHGAMGLSKPSAVSESEGRRPGVNQSWKSFSRSPEERTHFPNPSVPPQNVVQRPPSRLTHATRSMSAENAFVGDPVFSAYAVEMSGIPDPDEHEFDDNDNAADADGTPSPEHAEKSVQMDNNNIANGVSPVSLLSAQTVSSSSKTNVTSFPKQPGADGSATQEADGNTSTVSDGGRTRGILVSSNVHDALHIDTTWPTTVEAGFDPWIDLPGFIDFHTQTVYDR